MIVGSYSNKYEHLPLSLLITDRNDKDILRAANLHQSLPNLTSFNITADIYNEPSIN